MERLLRYNQIRDEKLLLVKIRKNLLYDTWFLKKIAILGWGKMLSLLQKRILYSWPQK